MAENRNAQQVREITDKLDNKFFTSKKKKLTKKIAAELLDKGWCRETGLYTPKRQQLYDAVIRLDDTGGKYVSFKMEFDR